MQDGRLNDAPARLRPQHGQYHSLLALRERYAALAARPWPELPGSATVRPGARDRSIPALRRMLGASGDLAGNHVTASTRLDDAVSGALRAFQARHGLPSTGVLEARTRAALNVTPEQRLRQIDVNIERWRFAPRDLGARHVRVNIPDFYLALMENGRVRVGMRVVVGEKETPTPVLSDEMRHIVFSPYWNIPESIATGEMLPALMDDPGYLGRNNIELVRVSDGAAEPVDPAEVDWSSPLDPGLRFRQKPGATNALGLVKFVFPNHSSIYLHDTPADALFDRVTRALSHGCVRVERPVDLAYALLSGQGWDRPRIAGAMHRMEEQWVRLTQPVPVHLMYLTAWVDGSGRAQFRDDIYGHDAAQGRVLDRVSAAAKPRSKP
jgi:murein L,D-transpeptidase YcbB/YkuD